MGNGDHVAENKLREEEIHTKVSIATGNRLQSISISNKHAGIVGMPAVDNDDAELVMKAILAMRGINQKKHKAEYAAGTLMLTQIPMSYKGTAHAWLRNSGKSMSTKTGPPGRRSSMVLK